MPSPPLSLFPLPGIPEVAAGDDVASHLAAALAAGDLDLRADDALVVAQKIVSKAEGCTVDLRGVKAGERARELARLTGKEAPLVEVILSESTEVLRTAPNVLIVRHRCGFVMANAGIDRSNVPGPDGSDTVLLLPRDPDASAAALRTAIGRRCGVEPAVVISDSFGRPWRLGVVNIAIGAAGLPSLIDRRGELDRVGRALEMTEVALADAVAAAAGLVMGEAAEGTPAVLVRGLRPGAYPVRPAGDLLRPMHMDLFR